MRYLIVTADDFGLSKSINEGIVKAYRDGIVTSINLMPAGWAFEDALALAGSIKLEEAGVHLSLTETSPVADLHAIPTLVTGKGAFHKTHTQFFLKLFSNRIEREHIYTELRAQLDRLKKTGIRINHISSHEHIHMMPYILDIFIELAKEYDIPAIRYPRGERPIFPFGIKGIYRKLILSYLERRMAKRLEKSGLIYTDNFLGFLNSGKIREEVLAEMFKFLREGTTELVTHPGFLSPEVLDRCIFYSDCETELAAVTSRKAKDLIADNGIKLISYREFLELKDRP